MDGRIRRVEETRRRPPQDAVLAELAERTTVYSAELARRQSEADAAAAELARIEADVAVVQARRRRDEGLLESTTAAKDAIGLQHELASLGNRLRDLEDAQLDAMQAAEDAAAAVTEQERALAENDAAARHGGAMSGPVWRFEQDLKGPCNVCMREVTGLFVEGTVADNALGPDRIVCPDCYHRWTTMLVAGERDRKTTAPAYVRST